MSKLADQIVGELIDMGDPERAQHSQRFFKTGKGEYGEGDVFLGIKVPHQRALAKRYKQATRSDTLDLLHSSYHEARLSALFLLVNLYNLADATGKTQIYKDYLDNIEYINNWDLVDSSALQIVGHYLFDKDRYPLEVLARSEDLWERRVAIIATYYFIRQYDFQDTLKLAEILLNDKEDLIHKAVGWMLREAGNRSRPTEEAFLQKHYQAMPRTMLRYAIEKFPEERRQAYLKGAI
ncbi:MAG: DNA alkylation repair protein [Candidatus Marinimicrobia bacterium]|jgi:3-methyladenine DNA glycosylase AlkD|nr:DNA alkylation repair protein [Candidatus Neomarinimicrobiota bacterium]MBT3632155.1 DNA alkylation repair protein [Candidatus Neomarinimicrobiota bacterium]MBT3824285.1 DNA alkylation repair protein [Candidatus Neomarinimicrobiota bacterium]MBT4129106.1 DNA alkylation repair protein [Candidatus Neomarinimicrobiota bacterium]MBT4295659.1 DNA alkylation repair protein [Candidatus Neomarinimicrobiota bacterium]